MLEQHPTGNASGEQPSTSFANRATPTIEISNENNENNTIRQPSNASSSNTQPTPAPGKDVSQTPDIDTSSEGQSDESFVTATNTVARHVHFRSTADITIYVVQTPVGTPPCSPRTMRRKLLRRRLFLSHQIDISSGCSTPQSREEDAVQDLYEGRYSISDDFRRWRQQQEEEAKRITQLKHLSQLKRSNTFPYPADRSISKETACGYYRISPIAYDVMNKRIPMPGHIGPVRTATRPTPSILLSSLLDREFDGRSIRHPREDLSHLEIVDMLTDASIQPSPWLDNAEPQPWESQNPKPVSLSSSGTSASVTTTAISTTASTSPLAFTASATSSASNPVPNASEALTRPSQMPMTQTAFSQITVSFPQGLPPSLSNLVPVNFPQGIPPSSSKLIPVSYPQGVPPSSTSYTAPASLSLSPPSSARPKHRSAPIFSKKSRHPSQAEMAQMSDAAREAYMSVAVTESSATQRKKYSSGRPSGSSNWIKTISNLVRPKPQQGTPRHGEGGGGRFGPGSGSLKNNYSSSSSSSRPTSTSSIQPLQPFSTTSSSLRLAANIPYSSQTTQLPSAYTKDQGYANSSTDRQPAQLSIPARTASQFPSTFRDPSGLAISRQITADNNSDSRITSQLSSLPQDDGAHRPVFESMSRQILTFATSPLDNGAGVGSIRNTSESSNGITTRTAKSASLHSSSVLLTSGPPRSSRLTPPDLRNSSYSYLPPLPAAMSPILPSVISASNGLAINSIISAGDNEVNTNTRLPDVSSNSPWEVDTNAGAGESQVAWRAWTEGEREEIRYGKRTDRMIRYDNQDNQDDQNGQDLEEDCEHLDEYYIDEDFYIEDDENEYEQGEEGEEEGTAATTVGDEDDMKELTGDGKTKRKKKKKTLLQRVKKGLAFLKPKKTSQPA